jgi:hypothetical protein
MHSSSGECESTWITKERSPGTRSICTRLCPSKCLGGTVALLRWPRRGLGGRLRVGRGQVHRMSARSGRGPDGARPPG